MATKPSEFPDWATNLENDPTSGEPNRSEPPTDKQDSGYDFQESPPRQWLNWKFWNIANWLRWNEEKIVGLGTAADVEADQNLRTTDDVSFNSVTIDGQESASKQSSLNFELGGDFDAGDTVTFKRSGDIITMQVDVASLSWSSDNTVSSNSIPSDFQPYQLFTQLVFIRSGDGVLFRVAIGTTVTILSLDSSGASVNTTGVDAFAVSYLA